MVHAIETPADDDDAARLSRLRWLADLLDTRFQIPGTGWRFGLDGVIGLIPGVGDAATGLLSAYIVMEGWRLGVRKRTLVRMIWNVAADAVLGALPLVGDLFDFAWKANARNVELILRDVSSRR